MSEDPRRNVAIASAIVLPVALVGLFAGIAQTRKETAFLRAGRRIALTAQVKARSYQDMRTARFGPNAKMYDGALARLEGLTPSPFDPVEQTEADRASALERRTSRRAYDGAPPTIPHAVADGILPDCMACHEKGLVLAGKRAPPMSHPRHDSCTQCHVPEVTRGPAPQGPNGGITPSAPEHPRDVPNGFEGLASSGRGERAWTGAPPTIPHATQMRTRCASCHGTVGAKGLRSTHPYRDSCTQCHAPSAVLNQRGPVALTDGGAP